MTTTTFGQRLRARRAARGMTQADLARALGRTQTCVSYWESDRREPSFADLSVLAKSLEISTDWLVLGERTGILVGTTEIAPGAACNDPGAGPEPRGGPEHG